MKEFDFDNAFGRPPAEFQEGMVRALSKVKEDKPVKKFSIRTLVLAAVLVLALCGIALAVSYTQGIEWFITQRDFLDLPKLPENFQEQVQSGIPQEGVGDLADILIQDAIWLDGSYKYTPNSFQMTFKAVLKDAEKYEMHESIQLNNDGDTSERNDEDWLWTDAGHGPIPEMMTDPKKQLVFFKPGIFTVGTPDGFAMPLPGGDSLRAEDGSLLYRLYIGLDGLDPVYLQETYGNMKEEHAKLFLETGLENAKAYQEAKAKYTDESGLTTLVLHYAVWEYPDQETRSHEGTLTFKVKLP